jgi:hypothetical protein
LFKIRNCSKFKKYSKFENSSKFENYSKYKIVHNLQKILGYNKHIKNIENNKKGKSHWAGPTQCLGVRRLVIADQLSI